MNKTKRKFKGLSPNCHYNHAKEFVDIDYAHKLSDKEAEWLANFLDNHYGGRFNHDDAKNPIKDRRQVWREGHARRRDFMSGRFKSRVLLDDTTDGSYDSEDLLELEKWRRGENEED